MTRDRDLPRPRGATAAAVLAAAALVLAAAAPSARAQDTVLVRRLSDVVVIRAAAEDKERILYYFRPTAELYQGDEVDQGVGGHTEISLPEGGRIELFSGAHVRFELLHPEMDVLAFPTFTTMDVLSLTRPIGLRLPGGILVTVALTEAHITLDVGRMTIRNEGGAPIEVRGPLAIARELGTGDHMIAVERGEEVAIPIFEQPASLPEASFTDWGALAVRQREGDYDAEPDGRSLRLSVRDDEIDVRPITVGGVRTQLRPGTELLIRDWRPHVDRPLPIAPAEGEADAGARIPDAASPERNDP